LLTCALQPATLSKIAIPGLKLTSADTKDGSNTVGKGTVIHKPPAATTPETSDSSDNSEEEEEGGGGGDEDASSSKV